MERLTVSKVSEKVGMTADTVRFYEREGLIPRPRRGDSGYRVYAKKVIGRLKALRRARNLGIGIKEIKELLALQDGPWEDTAEIKERAKAEIDKVKARINDLGRMRQALEDLVAACDGKKPMEKYPVIMGLKSDAYETYERKRGYS